MVIITNMISNSVIKCRCAHIINETILLLSFCQALSFGYLKQLTYFKILPPDILQSKRNSIQGRIKDKK